MDFNFFSEQVSKIENIPLPGESSHYKMLPGFRKKELPEERKRALSPKKAGVLALFYPDEENKTKLLLLLRKTYQGVHSNQIAFPGGKPEKEDVDILDTALREAKEEVGVSVAYINVIKALTEVYIPPSNFLVHPFFGLYQKRGEFVKQLDEVETLIEVCLEDFLDKNTIITTQLSTSYSNATAVPAYKLNGYVVWGATAMILSEIKELLKQVL